MISASASSSKKFYLFAQDFLCVVLYFQTVLFSFLFFAVSGDETARTNSIIDASTGILALLFVIIIVWFVLDNFVLENYTGYTFTVFPVFILGLSGLVGKLRFRSLGSNRNLIFASVILAFAVLFFIIRICLFVYRLKQRRKTAQHATSVGLEEKA